MDVAGVFQSLVHGWGWGRRACIAASLRFASASRRLGRCGRVLFGCFRGWDCKLDLQHHVCQVRQRILLQDGCNSTFPAGVEQERRREGEKERSEGGVDGW